uniref:Uncharacterized protein n=1 Tax=Zooxanthella nutricula TaxID=1333877 RepID=A0A7S2IV78_9DINO
MFLFVSHSWGGRFKDFVDTLVRHAATMRLASFDAAYWICTFSNNQWEVAEEMGIDIKDSSFYFALQHKTCRGTVMVINDNALPLERIWCLFEAATTCERDQVDETFHGLLLCNTAGVLNHGTGDMDIAIQIARRLMHVDLRNAQASVAADKQVVLSMVDKMEGGLGSINGYVRSGIRSALMQMHVAFEQDFNKVVLALSRSAKELVSLLSEHSLEMEPRKGDLDESTALSERSYSHEDKLMRVYV